MRGATWTTPNSCKTTGTIVRAKCPLSSHFLLLACREFVKKRYGASAVDAFFVDGRHSNSGALPEEQQLQAAHVHVSGNA